MALDVKSLHTGPHGQFKIERLGIWVVVLAGSIAVVARRCGAILGSIVSIWLVWLCAYGIHKSWQAVVLLVTSLMLDNMTFYFLSLAFKMK